MSESITIPAMENYRENSLCSKDQYEELYKYSLENNDAFWEKQAKNLEWDHFPSKINESTYSPEVQIKWFSDGKLNVSSNCVDRHLKNKADQVAIIWEPDNPKEEAKTITYKQLHLEVCKFTNVLLSQGVKKGDRVSIYMPMIPEAAYAMLACARIGAIHSVVFAGFSPESLAGRIIDCKSEYVITADESIRGGKVTPLKTNVDQAILKSGDIVKKVFVIKRTGGSIQWNEKTDVWYHDLYEQVDDFHSPEPMNAEDPLFILYTSGSTGKPKGVLHTCGGYLTYAATTHKYVFDYQDGDIYWCTADVGWITGHSYIVYGPLANGATTLMHEGTPTYPDASRHWDIVDKHKVNIYYTAPTAIRALMACGDEFLKKSDRKSLKVLGSVGEPINPEAWRWYYEKVGNKTCPIVDTWWQTETGGIMITPLPAARDLKPGSATLPFFGISPKLLDEEGLEVEGEASGKLAIKQSWPGQMRTVYGDHKRFIDTYFSQFPGYYFTGDGCHRDEDGFLWITGRVDDVINVSGHRLGTAEIESSLVAHPEVAEAAVVGFPHDIKGQGIYAYVILNINSQIANEDAKETLKQWVRKDIGPIACPDEIQVVPSLPKTRSGKIMRRILRKISVGDYDSLGDVSTLADPDAVSSIIAGHKSN
jgi:acetyl-CoA synthetase